ncbi:hypothetical protein J6590_044338 [Homalodisca vitripennis]|nr:hypothetical protein J6590_044338 [Homalodisca vitripennis]
MFCSYPEADVVPKNAERCHRSVSWQQQSLTLAQKLFKCGRLLITTIAHLSNSRETISLLQLHNQNLTAHLSLGIRLRLSNRGVTGSDSSDITTTRPLVVAVRSELDPQVGVKCTAGQFLRH